MRSRSRIRASAAGPSSESSRRSSGIGIIPKTFHRLHRRPREVGIELPELDADQLVGRKFSIPGTATDDEDSSRSILYYCEHQALRDNRITVLSRDGDRFRVRWTGITPDVNQHDAGQTPMRVKIEGEFRFDDMGKWIRG